MTAMNEKFEGLLDLESALRGARASLVCQTAGVPPWRMKQMRRAAEHAQDVLYGALDALTPEEMAEYGDYRAQAVAEMEERRASSLQ